MTIRTVETRPYPDQVPGTSGLRKRVAVFRQPHYLENFVQAILDTAGQGASTPIDLVLGGDGRFLNLEATQTVLRIAAANGVRRILVGQNAILSTPAASHLIRKHGLSGGLVLSASHNPGGPEGDFGIKYNVSNGGPAPEAFTTKVAARAAAIARFRTLESGPVPLDAPGRHVLGTTIIEVIDPVRDWADLMERLFDFEAIRGLFAAAFV